MFKGSHQLAVDEKGRVAIPARFRQSLAERCDSQLVITRSLQSCLELYPLPEFERVVHEIEALPDREEAEAAKQWFVGFAVDVELDKQGRVLLPPMLRDAVNITTAAVLMGQNTRFDLWSEEAWNQRFGAGLGHSPALQNAFRTIRR